MKNDEFIKKLNMSIFEILNIHVNQKHDNIIIMDILIYIQVLNVRNIKNSMFIN